MGTNHGVFSREQAWTALLVCMIMGLGVFSAPAQMATWSPGAELGAGGQSATTGTLVLENLASERDYSLQRLSARVSLRFLRLSGEREVRLQMAESTPGRQVFLTESHRLEIRAVGPRTIVADFSTTAEGTGLALLGFSSDDRTTTTLLPDFSGIVYNSPEGPVTFRVDALRSFRSLERDETQILAPLDRNASVRFVITTEDLTMRQIRELGAGAPPPGEPNARASLLAPLPPAPKHRPSITSFTGDSG